MWWQQCASCHASKDARVAPSGFGFWRQYEAYDCPDLDSIHNDGERHIPYIMFLPDGTRSKLAAWAGNQEPNGMLAEQILNTHPDKPQGMLHCSSTKGCSISKYRLSPLIPSPLSVQLILQGV
jgi:hypothetical protein